MQRGLCIRGRYATESWPSLNVVFHLPTAVIYMFQNTQHIFLEFDGRDHEHK